MPIADITHRLPRVGKIRLGEQVEAANGKSRPAKLETFRITSQSERVIAAVAAAYGGTPSPWDAPDGTKQFQVTIDAVSIDVLITPGDEAFSQWNEQWSAAGCSRRCDGITEQLSGDACKCPFDKDKRAELAKSGKACKPTTRVSVVLPKVPALGAFTMETHGQIAASELASTFALLDMTGAREGRLLPARLRLEQRVAKKDGQTNRFAVPVLEIATSLGDLIESFGGALAAPAGVNPATGEIVAGSVAALPAAEPVNSAKKAAANRAEARQQSVIEQGQQLKASDPMPEDEVIVFAARIKQLEPENQALIKTMLDAAGIPWAARRKVGERAKLREILAEVEAKNAGPWEDRRKAVFTALAELGINDDEAARHAFIRDATGGATESTKTLTQEQANQILDAVDLALNSKASA